MNNQKLGALLIGLLLIQLFLTVITGIKQEKENQVQDQVINTLIEEVERMDYQIMLLRAFKADMLGEDLDSMAFHVQPK